MKQLSINWKRTKSNQWLIDWIADRIQSYKIQIWVSSADSLSELYLIYNSMVLMWNLYGFGLIFLKSRTIESIQI